MKQTNPAAIPTPRYETKSAARFPTQPSYRDSLLKSMTGSSLNIGSPNKRPRFEDSGDSSPTSGPKPGESKPSAAAASDEWEKARGKRNGRRQPVSQSSLKGIPYERRGKSDESLLVYLFRYSSDASEESVMKHFQGGGVGAYSCKELRNRISDVKNFVLKIKAREDFGKVIRCLPVFTGCRWFKSGSRPDRNEKVPYFFNNGHRITGPDVESYLLNDDDDMDTGLEFFTPKVFPAVTSPSSKVQGSGITGSVAAAGGTSTPSATSGDSAGSSGAVSSSVGSSAATTTVSSGVGSGVVTSTASSNTSSIMSSITPLSSPHLHARNVQYTALVCNT